MYLVFNFRFIDLWKVIDASKILTSSLVIEHRASCSMREWRRWDALLCHSDTLNPKVLIKVVDDQISQALVEIVHTSIDYHESVQNHCNMIPSTKSLYDILGSCDPKSPLNVKMVHLSQSIGLCHAKDSWLTSIEDKLALICDYSVII